MCREGCTCGVAYISAKKYNPSVCLPGIREICSTVLRHGSLDTAEQMVEYNYEPVQGDQVITVTQ